MLARDDSEEIGECLTDRSAYVQRCDSQVAQLVVDVQSNQLVYAHCK